MHVTMLDCYTDEPSGLGVPPYIITYIRYIAGALREVNIEPDYITIDDLRAYVKGVHITKEFLRKQMITPVSLRNTTKNNVNTLLNTTLLIIVCGVHTPGKYLSANPGTTKEVHKLLSQVGYKGRTILTGPASVIGSGLYGGRRVRKVEQEYSLFDYVMPNVELSIGNFIKTSRMEKAEFNWDRINRFALEGAYIVKKHPLFPDFLMVEIETSMGCKRKVGCSFCTEPLKAAWSRREPKAVVQEIKTLSKEGVKNFRIGKQTCFYSYANANEMHSMLKEVRPLCEVLHLDNCNPAYVTEEKTKLICDYMTEGNIAAFGVESFDENVVKANRLNTSPAKTIEAVRIINKYGAARGKNGMPLFLPGINLIFGLIAESKKSHECNMNYLKQIIDEGLMLRRINIRQVSIFPGTLMHTHGGRELKKNRKRYWSWRNQIRQEIDYPLLKRLVPNGTVLKKLRTEIYDGNTTFARQVGTYPLTVGIKKRIELDRFIDVKVTSHMLRSVTAQLL